MARALDRARRKADLSDCVLTLGCLTAILTAAPAAAREEAPVKRSHRAQPARTGQSSPDRTGSINRTAVPTVEAALPPTLPLPAAPLTEEASLVPVTLPQVPRSRMIACGESWQAMKMKGTTGDDSWREYALKCLVAKDAPAP